MKLKLSNLATLAAAFVIISGSMNAAEPYKHGPDSMRQDGVPVGKVTKHQFKTSQLFPGTVRDYWIYVPAQVKLAHLIVLYLLEIVLRFAAGWSALGSMC